MDLRVAKLKDNAVIPTRAHPGDAGLDLYSTEAAHLGPGERWSVGTGIALEIPEGHAGLVLPRSGLAREHGIALVNAPGLIDAGSRIGQQEIGEEASTHDGPIAGAQPVARVGCR